MKKLWFYIKQTSMHTDTFRVGGYISMGNYYEGQLIFKLKENIPKDLLHDLIKLSEGCDKDDLKSLNNKHWYNHEKFDYPSYIFSKEEWNNHRYYLFIVNLCMKGYMSHNDDLGLNIYNSLIEYIDKSQYDMSDGGYIGKVCDEDGTYTKCFYVDYNILNNKNKTNMKNKYEIYDVKAEMFDANKHFPDIIVLNLQWTANIGFGEISFMYNTSTKEWDYDTECMGRDFCKAVLNKWIDNLINC